jgi:hypothetical protein
LLQDEKWQLAQKLLDFATETEAFNRNFSSEKARRTVVINRAQAYKWAGDQDKALRILKREDWSATSDEFKLAEAVLLDDFEQANIILRKIGTSDPMGKANLKGWPLFRKYRETEGFLSVYEEIFQEPFHTVEIDPTKAEEPSINSEKEQFESDEDDMSSFDGQEEDTP